MRARLRSRQLRADEAAADDAVIQELSEGDREIVRRVRPYTLTSAARLGALLEAVRYCVGRDVPGDFAECGVWRGGSVMAMILALQALGREDRDIHLFDTFAGMTEPGELDLSRYDRPARDEWEEAHARGDRPWSGLLDLENFSEAAVRELLDSTGYPRDRVHFVAGRVEETLPERAPARVALLRLDTDWYASTRHELEHLYPRLADGGVLIVDDYGHWDGCRRAVDEYFAAVAPRPLLQRIDYTGRIGVKH